ncbi:MAG: TRAP transporter small permease subunit [candidate division NC10 bacterium]|nr:TRAP transporter small permease subunit [candidate division NC10 bacterium]
MRGLRRIDAVLAKAERVLIVIVLSVMLLLAFLQVLLRNAWDFGLPWIDILLRHLVLWLGIMGASLATRMNRHIRIEALLRFLPARHQRFVERGVLLIAAAICTLLGVAAVDLVRQEQATGSMAFGPVPTWMLQLVLPVGFAIVAFRFGLQTFSPTATPAGDGGVE